MAGKYDDKDEVLWIISVTKMDDWSKEKFEHEYHVVHAGMTVEISKFDPNLRHYMQIANLEFQNREDDQPVWNCITCLTWANLQAVWDGLQTPGYKASAGKHPFCRLDQVGTLARVFDGFRGVASAGEKECKVLVFHRNNSPGNKDDSHGSKEWLKQRSALARKHFSEDPKLISYRLLQDVTPQDTDFFRDTGFAVGSWDRYMAVEEIGFLDREQALEFVKKHENVLGTSLHISPP